MVIVFFFLVIVMCIFEDFYKILIRLNLKIFFDNGNLFMNLLMEIRRVNLYVL